MKTFYQHLMTFRGKRVPDDKSRLADWAFFDHDFPKHSNDYDELSNYLEWNSPFANALRTFDEIWDLYQNK
ncbi:YozE family protein [Oceanobacillus luteolus]|uniref:UPF0346 protein ACFSBH_11605 n=1 Tax=Oceanobacillus luteolus TaxID=1274358 RepID=A0ABW4HS01_9BACI|nr:YozE family protein [Oceanobacillus luteolus]MCM3738913.1 YozE family protein [Oceanobacillus luteolus]